MEDTIINYFLITFLLLFILKLLLQKRRRSSNLPPSPPALPIIGHLHLTKHPLHRSLDRLSKKYGPVFSVRFGSRLVAVVSSPSAVEECFGKNDIVLANRPKVLTGVHLGYNHSVVTASPYGEHWRNLRRICTLEIFSSNRLNAFLGVRKDEIRRLLVRLSRDSRDGRYAKVELKSLLSALTFNIISRMVAGKRCFVDDVEDEESKLAREMLKELAENDSVSNPEEFVPLLMWIDPFGLDRSLAKLGKKMDTYLQGLIEEHRVDKSRDTMINHLFSLQESQPEYYTDQIIKGLMLVMFLAGTDTSSITLEWAMSNLLNHPETLKKVKDEIDAHLGQDQLIDESDISKLPYLQSVISETLRLYPAAPLLLPHMPSEDCNISGFDIPRDTILIVNAWSIHRDPELWDDPTSFKPERFENGSGAETYKLMPFGIGRRACPGAGLANRMVSLALGSLIQGFEWKRIGEDKIDMVEGKGVSMPKLVPLEAMCKARPIMNKIVGGT